MQKVDVAKHLQEIQPGRGVESVVENAILNLPETRILAQIGCVPIADVMANELAAATVLLEKDKSMYEVSLTAFEALNMAIMSLASADHPSTRTNEKKQQMWPMPRSVPKERPNKKTI